MTHEGFENKIEDIQQPEVKQLREGVTAYIFKGLAVAIDTTGKNYKALPELSFGPFNNELNTGSLAQPEKIKQGVDMKYASECIKKVAEISGIHQFWFYPLGNDVPLENKEAREKARMRLFEKISPNNIKPTPEEYGYILTV